MSDTVILALAFLAIWSELRVLQFIRQIGSQLTGPLRIAFWAKRVCSLLVIVSAALSLVSKHLQSALWFIFVTSVFAWAVAWLGYWIVRITGVNRASQSS